MDQGMCLGVEDIDGDIDMEAPPMSASAYLAQLREERKQCADVVATKATRQQEPKEKKQWEGTAGLNMREEKIQTEGSLVPTVEWRNAKCAEFDKNRQIMEKMRSIPNTLKFTKPLIDDEEKWHELLLEKCHPLFESIAPMFPNHIGTPPSVNFVCSLKLRTIDTLLPYLVEWAEAEGLTRPIREWIYAFLLCISLPLIPEVTSALRDLAKHARRVRSKLDASRINEANEYSFFITIVSQYFLQRDLAD